MSYKSHASAPTRAFDHLYDPVFTASRGVIQKLNMKGLSRSAPLHILPCYHFMFSAAVNKPRNFYFLQRNPLPVDGSVAKCYSRSINTDLFYGCPIDSQYQEEDEPLPVKASRSVSCQTQYRESSTQTDPWLPDAVVRLNGMQVPECLLVDCATNPGVREIEAIERARRRREWERQLPAPTSKDEMSLRISILEAFEWENIIAREKDFNDDQQQRMDYVLKAIEQRHENHRRICQQKLLSAEKQVIDEMKKQKSQLQLSFQRKLRKISALQNGSREIVVDPQAESKVLLRSIVELRDEFKTLSLPGSGAIKLPSLGHRELWRPKERIKECERNVWTAKELTLMSETMKRNKLMHLAMASKRVTQQRFSIYADGVLEEVEKAREQDAHEDDVVVQRIIKGFVIRKKLREGMESSLESIQQLANKFPIDCVQELLAN